MIMRDDQLKMLLCTVMHSVRCPDCTAPIGFQCYEKGPAMEIHRGRLLHLIEIVNKIRYFERQDKFVRLSDHLTNRQLLDAVKEFK